MQSQESDLQIDPGSIDMKLESERLVKFCMVMLIGSGDTLTD